MRSPFVREVRAFVVSNFLLGKGDTLTDDASFLELGIVDSTGMLELVSYLEKSFEIKITDDELIPDNLDSISKIVDYLSRKLPNQKVEPAAVRQKAYSAD
jgi:acyl carrier protein